MMEKNLLKSIDNEDTEKVKLILKNKNVLNLNNIKDEKGNYPLLLAIYKNNIEIVKLLIEYANQHQIILKLNEKK
eukprot:jgi/Orpsp1_1/1182869/evm.model.c7180000082990.1